MYALRATPSPRVSETRHHETTLCSLRLGTHTAHTHTDSESPLMPSTPDTTLPPHPASPDADSPARQIHLTSPTRTPLPDRSTTACRRHAIMRQPQAACAWGHSPPPPSPGLGEPAHALDPQHDPPVYPRLSEAFARSAYICLTPRSFVGSPPRTPHHLPRSGCTPRHNHIIYLASFASIPP